MSGGLGYSTECCRSPSVPSSGESADSWDVVNSPARSPGVEQSPVPVIWTAELYRQRGVSPTVEFHDQRALSLLCAAGTLPALGEIIFESLDSLYEDLACQIPDSRRNGVSVIARITRAVRAGVFAKFKLGRNSACSSR